MAYDKIITIHARLDRRINYALNPAKTGDGNQNLCAALNCQPDTAYRDMQETKCRWGKEKRPVQGYHIIHSYAPGEVRPEQAQELSVEFARQLLGDRFEAVIATHVDHEHIHSHIVFNSVSCTDGRMFRGNFKAYYGDIRGVSNAISRENGLSVIESKRKGKQYAQWNAEKQGKPTIRGLIRQDIDGALAGAISMQTLFAALEKQGYTVKRGANVKYTAIRPPGSERFIRLDSLGEGYTEADLKARLREKAAKTPPVQVHIPRQKRYSVKRYGGNSRKTKPKGLRRIYLHYLYLLAPPRPYQRRPVPFNVRAEVRKLSQYKRQFALLQKYRIENESQLSMLADALQAEIDSLVFFRQNLYRRKRRGEDVAAEISEINHALRPLRRELRCCQSISASVPQIHEHIRLAGQAEEQSKNKFKEKEVKQHGSER